MLYFTLPIIDEKCCAIPVVGVVYYSQIGTYPSLKNTNVWDRYNKSFTKSWRLVWFRFQQTMDTVCLGWPFEKKIRHLFKKI